MDPQEPIESNFLMPAEWEPHEATWIAWPHNQNDWPGKFECIPWVYAEIVRRLAAHERVHIVVNNAVAERDARRILRESAVPFQRIRFHRWPTDRVWTRDSGPIFVRSANKKTVLLHWKFNAWAKYSNWKKDARLPGHIAAYLGLQETKPSMGNSTTKRGRHLVLEGGSIDVNGKGTLLTTEECLLSKVQARNPGVSRLQLEEIFAKYLGIKSVIWLRRGIAGDDTHGHVDDIARFVSPGTVVAAVEENRSDANYKPLRENLLILKSSGDQDGEPLQIIELPMPAPVIFKGQRLPASYANFYIANGLVLVPTFNDSNDRVAVNILANLFPSREVIGIHCRDFIWGLGAIHCMTQQQPAAR